MEQKISPECESKLAGAIEKAASRTTVNEELDRSSALAEELKAAGIPARFAKVATAAYNKRLTVMTFKRRDDTEKAKPFPLADSVKVASLLGDAPLKGEKPSAPTFEIIIHKAASGSMDKAASLTADNGKLPFEYRVDRGVYLDKLESMVERHTAILDERLQKQASAECQLRVEKTRLAEILVKNAVAFDTLKNLHGTALKNLLSDAMPEGTDFSKTANGAIRPSGMLYDQVDALLDKQAKYDEDQEFLCEYAEGLQEFCTSASNFADKLVERDCGQRKTALDAFSAVGGGVSFVPGIGEALHSLGVSALDGYEQALSNAREMYHKGTDNSKHPGSVMDAEFLLQDRYRDRMMGWADMAADPQFSMYPSEQVFNATQKAMNIDTSLERPDRREMLRTTVGQLLAQNNRMSGADIAALATTIKGLEASKGNLQEIGRAAVNALDKVRGTDPADIKFNLAEKLDKAHTRNSRVYDILSSSFKELGAAEDKRKAERKEQEKENKRLAERAEDKAEKARERAEANSKWEQERKDKRQMAAAELRQKRLSDRTRATTADKDRQARTDIADKDRELREKERTSRVTLADSERKARTDLVQQIINGQRQDALSYQKAYDSWVNDGRQGPPPQQPGTPNMLQYIFGGNGSTDRDGEPENGDRNGKNNRNERPRDKNGEPIYTDAELPDWVDRFNYAYDHATPEKQQEMEQAEANRHLAERAEKLGLHPHI